MAKTVYKTLLNQFDGYVTRRVGAAGILGRLRDDYQAELDTLNDKIKDGINSMTPEEYRLAKKRIGELNEELSFANDRLQMMETASAVTDEEYKAWREAMNGEQIRLRDECEKEVYRLLGLLVEYCEKELVEIDRLNALSYNFEYSIGKHEDTLYPVTRQTPGYLYMLLEYLLVFYNDLDEKLNGKERQTTGIDEAAKQAAHHEISQIGAQVGFAATQGLNIPTKDEAFKDIKYNKPNALAL